jgi:hypothetical protein
VPSKHEIASRHYVQQFDVLAEIATARSLLLMEGLSPSQNARTVTQS